MLIKRNRPHTAQDILERVETLQDKLEEVRRTIRVTHNLLNQCFKNEDPSMPRNPYFLSNSVEDLDTQWRGYMLYLNATFPLCKDFVSAAQTTGVSLKYINLRYRTFAHEMYGLIDLLIRAIDLNKEVIDLPFDVDQAQEFFANQRSKITDRMLSVVERSSLLMEELSHTIIGVKGLLSTREEEERNK